MKVFCFYVGLYYSICFRYIHLIILRVVYSCDFTSRICIKWDECLHENMREKNLNHIPIYE